MWTSRADDLIRLALAEDIGTGDRTTLATIGPGARARASVVAKERLILAGVAAFERVFRLLDGRVAVARLAADGDEIEPGARVLSLEGPTRALLVGERTALNILQRLCGTATLTRRFVEAVAGTPARIVDTRKTAPGMRVLQKEAVAAGGGSNHRFGLDSGILVKDNHIAACGSVAAALDRVRAGAPHTLRVEVEVGTLAELEEALGAEAEAVLLDNMDDATLAEAVRRVRATGRPILAEASGNMDLDRVRRVAELGVDLISVGALTHSAPAADLSMRIEP